MPCAAFMLLSLAGVCVLMTESSVRLWICKRGRATSQEPHFPSDCISVTLVASDTWRSTKASCWMPSPGQQQQGQPWPHPCAQARGLALPWWGGKGGQERQRPFQNWEVWDEMLAPRAEEELQRVQCGKPAVRCRCSDESPVPAWAEAWSFHPPRSSTVSSRCSAWLHRV